MFRQQERSAVRTGEVMHTVIKNKLERFKLVRLLISIYRIKAVRALFPLLIIGLVYLEGQHEPEANSFRQNYP